LKKRFPNCKIISASTGNHGLGVAHALSITGLEGTIYLPHNASAAKVHALTEKGVKIILHGSNVDEAESYARSLDGKNNQVYVSPYNDIDVIAGQGTIGREIYRQLPSVDVVFISIGGGGLISGVASYLKSINPAIQIIGCLPQNAPAMYRCIQAGKIIDVAEQPTLSDATAGGIESNSLTFDMCKKYVDGYILVNEEEILLAMQYVYKHHNQLIEGSAGVAVASLLKGKNQYQGKKAVVIVCGGNMNQQTQEKIRLNYDKNSFVLRN
jgi:threonine dehydratase